MRKGHSRVPESTGTESEHEKELQATQLVEKLIFRGFWVRVSFLISTRMDMFREHVYNTKLEKHLAKELKY